MTSYGNGRLDNGIFGWSNRTKEIIRDGEQKTFIGKPHVVLNITHKLDDSFDTLVNPNKLKVLTEPEFIEFKPEINNLLADPSYQFGIIEMIADSIDSYWKYKKLGGTWIETKADAIKNVDQYLNEAFEKLGIEISVYYNIDSFGSSIRTAMQPVGLINGTQIKSCDSYHLLLEASRPYILKRINEDMKPLVESDETKIENDLMMLQTLLKRYPNYKDLILATKPEQDGAGPNRL